MPVVATGRPFRSQASSRCASTVGCPDSRSIQGELSMRTLPLAEEHGAGRAEAHLATERPERAVGLVLRTESAGRCGRAPVAARGGGREREPARPDVHHQPLAVADLPRDELLRQGRLDRALDDALERPGRVDGVDPPLGEEVLGPVGEHELEVAVREPGLEPRELNVDDLPQVRAPEGMEDHHVVDAVQELGAEVLAERLQHLLLHGVVGTGVVAAIAGEQLAPDVRGHDDDRVLEVDRAPVAVGQAAVVEDLEEHVEDVVVRLLDLVEEDDAVRPAADGLGQLPALLVALLEQPPAAVLARAEPFLLLCELALELGELPVPELGHLVEIVLALGLLDLLLRLVDLLAQLAEPGDGGLLALPLRAERVRLLAEIGQLLLEPPESLERAGVDLLPERLPRDLGW